MEGRFVPVKEDEISDKEIGLFVRFHDMLG
jgi:hypothetical protein